MAISFLGAAQDVLDMRLRPKPHHVRGFAQLLTRLLPVPQQRAGVRIDEGLGSSLTRASCSGNTSNFGRIDSYSPG
jgi:hypothetical protein